MKTSERYVIVEENSDGWQPLLIDGGRWYVDRTQAEERARYMNKITDEFYSYHVGVVQW